MSRVNFVRQQGFREASAEACAYRYPALMWQPRAIGILLLAGVGLQAWPYFLVVSAVLWWSALLPGLNPFDALYNSLVASPKGRPPLAPAPAPRRFAQALAGSFMLAIAISLLAGFRVLAWTLEAVLLAAIGALIFGRFCAGSYAFLVLSGDTAFANRTLPWARTE